MSTSVPLPLTRPVDSGRVALIGGPALIAASNLAFAVMVADGGGDGTVTDDLALAAGHPGLYLAGTLLGLAACVLLIPAIWTVARFAAGHSRRLATIAAWVTATGYVFYVVQLAQGLVVRAVAIHPGGNPGFVDAVEKANENPGYVALFIVMAFGVLVGPVLLGIALLRHPALPKLAGAAVIAWTVLHIAGVSTGIAWIEVVAALGLVIGFGLVATHRRDA